MTCPILLAGDCLDVLRTFGSDQFDAIVTDPPYGLAQHRPDVVTAAVVAWAQGDRERVPDGRGFMGRDWDAFVPPPAVWDECLRVLKPGGHLLAFAGSRTYDLMGLSIRMAGFEIRDGLQWIYGSGFPKGIDVSKAISKSAVPATPEPQRWEGWNTSLKPSHEPIVMARKPLTGTVAANVLAHGTGALNIDASRVSSTDALVRPAILRTDNEVFAPGLGAGTQVEPGGRWPSNVLLSHNAECASVCVLGCQVAELDAQSGTLKSGANPTRRNSDKFRNAYGDFAGQTQCDPARGADSGGASRFFPTFRYQAKAPASERPKLDGQAHPTVKPLALMAWLVRLVTPPGGTVLDPFAGSGTTLQAARDEGFWAFGIERDPAYLPLIAHRLGLDSPTQLAEPDPAALPADSCSPTGA